MIGPAQGTVNIPATNQVFQTELCRVGQGSQFCVAIIVLTSLLRINVDI
jgi:hypothetical protein